MSIVQRQSFSRSSVTGLSTPSAAFETRMSRRPNFFLISSNIRLTWSSSATLARISIGSRPTAAISAFASAAASRLRR
jgi:hypothetical protein